MSTHSCDVVEVKLGKHPNADFLSVVKVGGWQVLVKTTDWNDGDLGVYIPPDSLVDTSKKEFSFLSPDTPVMFRVRVKKMRGFVSQGLLIPAPQGAEVGDDMMGFFGVEHYEPPLPLSSGGDNEVAPWGHYPKYDVENYNRYPVLQDGEEVVITEKIHGANARFKWYDGRLYCGSRTNWKKYNPLSIWWKAAEQNPWIAQWCERHPKITVYGEVFGNVQSLKYGAGNNQIFLRVFDLWDGCGWINFAAAMILSQTDQLGMAPSTVAKLQWAPILYKGPFDEKVARELAEGNSSIHGAKHCAEGVVVRPVVERFDEQVGRVQLKIVSNRYLSKE
jgi:RNA ligase (TIGR02306 family)